MNKKIKILLSIRQGKIGGGERHVLDICENIDLSKFQIFVLSFSDGEMIKMLNEKGINNLVIPTKRPFNIFAIRKIYKYFKKVDPDIFHAHGTRAFSNLLFPAKKMNKPILYTIHGWSFHPDQELMVYWFRQKIENYLCRKANLNIFVSDSDRNLALQEFKIKNAAVIKNGIRTDFVPPPNKKLKEEFNNKFLVGFIGRLTKQKDPQTLLSVANILKDNSNIHFIIVGDGELRFECEKFKKKHALKNIDFLGFRNDVYEILYNLDVFCLPSLWEGLPISLLEAMIMERPIVASRIPGNTDLISDRKNGLLFNPKDCKELSEKICLYYNNQSLRRSLSRNAYQDALNNHDVKVMVRNIQDTYLHLLS